MPASQQNRKAPPKYLNMQKCMIPAWLKSPGYDILNYLCFSKRYALYEI